MPERKQRLELTWVGKENRPRLEPRILLEEPEKSYHAPHRVTDHLEYQPDFVAETKEAIHMLEPKMSTQMGDAEVLAKCDAAVAWCGHASDYAAAHGGKRWSYALIPHTAISENMTVSGLVAEYRVGGK